MYEDFERERMEQEEEAAVVAAEDAQDGVELE